MDSRILGLIATVIERCERPREPGPGHPPAATVCVLATLRQFLREGTPWRSLKASDKVSGSTLRRCLEHWAQDGVPVACTATAATVNDTLVFERLFLAAFAVMARIATVFADKGYDAEGNRALCRRFGAEPCIHKRGRPHGSGLGQKRWPVECSNAWVLENRRLALRYDRLGFIRAGPAPGSLPILVAGRLVREF